MSGAADLRAAFVYAAQCWYADGMVNGREYGELADALMAVLGDVREGWDHVVDGTHIVTFAEPVWVKPGVPIERGLWVRPRRETTE